MSISSIGSLTQTSSLQTLSFKPSSSSQQADGVSDTDKTSMSKMASMMKQLKDLEQTDPAKAKQVLQSIASKLDDAASKATGDDAKHLKDLASKFTDAANTGDLSKLGPPKGGPHGPPPTQASSTSQTASYKRHANNSDMQQVESIIEDALGSGSSSS